MHVRKQVFQRRLDGSLDFYRDWREYEKGFGDPSHEYWLGMNPKPYIEPFLRTRCNNHKPRKIVKFKEAEITARSL